MAKRYRKSWLLNTQFTTSCISTTLVLVLLGTIVLFVLTARNLSIYMRENINVSILLSDGMDGNEIARMKDEIAARPYIRHIEYISKEQAIEEECKAMGTDPMEFLEYNPFTASFETNINADYADKDSMAVIVSELKGDSRIVDVLYQKELIDSVNRNIGKASIILLIIAGLFTYISFALIHNTVRLSIFSHRFIINTMKLVGANWGFIRRPFLRNAFFLALISSVAADGIIFAGLHGLQKYEPEITAVINMHVIGIVSASVLLFGLIITFICTYFSLNRFLRMNSNELYYA
ncbi:MAG: permease-like cell division protein FtsX [Bacteroides sp.]|nr:permease-like cell division protein FtsX [Roseburia sp.]MCM1346753.1 permease-like cell division protein FtsX [Bacteroides sp.]MCM1421310.1 permease-like cell division protein FtsX [Bacteroides sp.]